MEKFYNTQFVIKPKALGVVLPGNLGYVPIMMAQEVLSSPHVKVMETLDAFVTVAQRAATIARTFGNSIIITDL